MTETSVELSAAGVISRARLSPCSSSSPGTGGTLLGLPTGPS
ncbi:MAG: hypothetical protein WCD11_19615 [Solirubrobacteraceae bacterium]